MRRIFADLSIIAGSAVLAVYLVRMHAPEAMLGFFGDGVLAASFIAGIFFTSIFTAVPATAFLGELAIDGNIFLIALMGGAGSVIGDYMIFIFIRDRLARDAHLIFSRRRIHKIKFIFEHGRFRWLLPLVGALLLVSPLPDEPGLALLGISSMRPRTFIFLSFILHAIGIALIGFAARALA